jgi:hypothetical protein
MGKLIGYITLALLAVWRVLYPAYTLQPMKDQHDRSRA